MKSWIKKYWWLAACMIVGIALPPCVNFLFTHVTVSSADDLQNPEWLSFWGSYLGGLLGSIAALIALALTLHQQEIYHKEACQADRLHLMPALQLERIPLGAPADETSKIIHVSPNGECVHDFKTDVGVCMAFGSHHLLHNDFLRFNLKNIGVGPAFNIHIYPNAILDNSNNESLGGLGPSDSISILCLMPIKESFDVDIRFSDVFDNLYVQHTRFTYTVSKDGTFTYFLSPTTPKLISASHADRS